MPVRGGAFFGFAVVIAIALLAWGIVALVMYVDDDSDSSDGGANYATPSDADNDIQAALNDARPGDVIYIPEGTHYISLTTAVDGTLERPITIRGQLGTDRDKVVLKGADDIARVLEILHSYYIIEDFTIDGEVEKEERYRAQLIFIEGARDPEDLDGFESSIDRVVVQNMIIKNAGQECIRMRYFVTNSVIQHNDIRVCGVYDFMLGDSGSNGEGIYIGTASGQWDDKNGKNVVDVCRGNLIDGNYIDTQGSEGVDVKEGSIENVVQFNEIYGELDENSGGIGIRGDYNIIRYNEIYESVGACIRLGGNKVDGDTYGTNNEVYGNDLIECEYSAVKVEESPQIICENKVIDPSDPDDEYSVVRGDAASEFDDITDPCSGLSTVTLPTTPGTSADDDFDFDEENDDDEDKDNDEDDDDDEDDDFENLSGDDADDGGAVIVDNDNSYTYLGCFSDNTNDRVLSVLVIDNSNDLSVKECVSECVDSGYKYAGLQRGKDCWCGNTEDYDQYGAGMCNFVCSGGSTECGGDSSFSLFLISGDGGVGPADDDFSVDDDGGLGSDEGDMTDDDDDDDDQAEAGDADDDDDTVVVSGPVDGDYKGCFRDSDADPILDFEYEDEKALTPASCVSHCKSEGEELAGLQAGRQCWCGTTDDYDRYGTTTCNIPCTGDPSSTCGGVASSNVWLVD